MVVCPGVPRDRQKERAGAAVQRIRPVGPRAPDEGDRPCASPIFPSNHFDRENHSVSALIRRSGAHFLFFSYYGTGRSIDQFMEQGEGEVCAARWRPGHAPIDFGRRENDLSIGPGLRKTCTYRSEGPTRLIQTNI